MRLFSLLIIFCISVSVFSQQLKTDSLLAVLKKAKEDTLKVKTLHNLFFVLEYENPSQAEEHLQSALSLSQKINYNAGQILSYKYFGFLCEDRDAYDEAIINYNLSLKISKEAGDKKSELAAYTNSNYKLVQSACSFSPILPQKIVP